MATPKHLECNICGHQQPYEPFVPAVCKKCDSQWLEARYDYEAFKREILRGFPNRPANMWRYQDVLPLRMLHRWISPAGDSALAVTTLCPRVWA
jgi:hypothetical protein